MAAVYNTTMDQGADWTLAVFYRQPAEITNIVGNGTTVTVTAENSFTPGQTISIDGVIPSQYNLQNVTVATATGSSFTITNGATGTYISGGIASGALDISGYTAKMQMRSEPNSADAVLTLETGSGITINGPTGEITMFATATQTGAVDEGPYYYDLEIYTGGNVTRVIQGQIVVSAQVTL